MTLCKDEYCSKEGLVQFTEATIYKAKVTYWLCEDHWQEKMDELHTPKPSKLEPVYYDYVETPGLWDRFWDRPGMDHVAFALWIVLVFVVLYALNRFAEVMF